MRSVIRLLVVVGIVAVSSSSFAQTKLAKSDGIPRVTNRIEVPEQSSDHRDHPLWPALELAVDSYKHIRRDIRDYACTVVRLERVRGELQPQEFMQAKVRHSRSKNGKVVIPFATYLKFIGPAAVKDRGVLFVQDRYDGLVFVRKGGPRFSFVTTKIDPNSDTAMHTNRYPITEFGFENLVRRLIEVAKADIASGAKTEVEFFRDAKVDGRSCTGVRVTHPNFDPNLRFHTATIFVDDEFHVPIHYEAYDWPRTNEDEPQLLERYTYRDIRLNVGFTDEDFDPNNPDYELK